MLATYIYLGLRKDGEIEKDEVHFFFMMGSTLLSAYLTQFSVFTVFHYLNAMRLFQHHEFQNHKRTLIMQAIIVVPSLFFLTLILYKNSLVASCTMFAEDLGIDHYDYLKSQFCKNLNNWKIT